MGASRQTASLSTTCIYTRNLDATALLSRRICVNHRIGHSIQYKARKHDSKIRQGPDFDCHEDCMGLMVKANDAQANN